ncbi:hypothetical protein ATANTOWER_020633 [Ataeniobius toweri]|uniref:Secreted protein n=1 Tax=Ataeniobius toweri TaxID=208326 RepID=A0ABU7B7U2_9TELE|nr:hypothetical protein [Ataeniobius toweri]
MNYYIIYFLPVCFCWWHFLMRLENMCVFISRRLGPHHISLLLLWLRTDTRLFESAALCSYGKFMVGANLLTLSHEKIKVSMTGKTKSILTASTGCKKESSSRTHF